MNSGTGRDLRGRNTLPTTVSLARIHFLATLDTRRLHSPRAGEFEEPRFFARTPRQRNPRPHPAENTSCDLTRATGPRIDHPFGPRTGSRLLGPQTSSAFDGAPVRRRPTLAPTFARIRLQRSPGLSVTVMHSHGGLLLSEPRDREPEGQGSVRVRAQWKLDLGGMVTVWRYRPTCVEKLVTPDVFCRASGEAARPTRERTR